MPGTVDCRRKTPAIQLDWSKEGNEFDTAEVYWVSLSDRSIGRLIGLWLGYCGGTSGKKCKLDRNIESHAEYWRGKSSIFYGEHRRWVYFFVGRTSR